MTDTSRIIEIESSPAKHLLLTLVGLLMTALGALLAFGIIPDTGPYGKMIGWVAFVIFALCTVVIVWRLFTQRGPVITISPQGIRDARIAAAIVPWRAITNISTWEYRGQRAMVVAVDPAVEKTLGLSRLTAWSRDANRSLGLDGLPFSASGLKIDFDTLLATSVAYWQAHRGT